MLAFAKKGPPASESTSKTGEVLTSIPALLRDYGKKALQRSPKMLPFIWLLTFLLQIAPFFFNVILFLYAKLFLEADV